MSKMLKVFILVFFLIYYITLYSVINNPEDLSTMTLEELMNLEVSFGTLTGIEQSKIPGTMTIITREDIALTPARNLLDLIEIYVPGAVYVMHFKGFRLGIRGMLSDQNYSYQIMVNGKNINSRASNGPLFELQEKDLSSIDKIEIISGSGSAVYGPGATAGIINIITRKPRNNFFSLSLKRDLSYRYENKAFYFCHGKDKLRYNFYGSISQSDGLENTKMWYIDRAQKYSDHLPYGWGYMNPDWGNYGLGSDVPKLLADYLNEPETKLNLDIEYTDNLRFFARYSTYNHSYMVQEAYTEEGPAFRGHLGKYFTGELQWKTPAMRKFVLTNKIGFSSKSFREISLWQQENLPFNHIAQRGNSYSENDLTLYTLLNYKMSNSYRFALGGEIIYEYYLPEWGFDDDSFIMNFQAPIRFAVLNEDSGFYNYYGETLSTIIDGDIDGKMYSVFGEGNLEFSPYFQVLFSSRVDKHEYSETVLSPRLALISQLSDSHQVKLIIERAVRMPHFSDLFAQHYLNGDAAEPETMNGVELQYQFMHRDNLTLKLNNYYYEIDQIGWIDEEHFSGQIGTYKLTGLEPEINYRSEKLTLGANYSFIKQLNWESKINIDAWILGMEGEEIFLNDNGDNRINNFPAQEFKAFMNYRITPEITFHANGRVMWDHQQDDMIKKFIEAHQEYGNFETIEVIEQISADLYEHGYSKPAFTTNFSINWHLSKIFADIDLQLYSMNLLSNNYLRYIIQFWEPGDVRQYPHQCGFIDEPLTVGINLNWNF